MPKGGTVGRTPIGPPLPSFAAPVHIGSAIRKRAKQEGVPIGVILRRAVELGWHIMESRLHETQDR